jgi:NAD(P)-dependent dehydrogenase (short-subunit alcohol dehydrogenase family)
MIIWITGASSGIGREAAVQYARLGHTVCASARSLEPLQALAEESAGLGGQIHPVEMDVTDVAQVAAGFADICKTFGLPDLVILNAGTYIRNTVKRFDRSVFETTMNINFMGTINCLEHVVPAYIEQGSGHVVVVSSVAGYRGLPGGSAYGASKAALINLVEAMQPELAARGVCISLVNPGFVRTPLTDKNEFAMPFLMEVDDAVRAMISGLSRRRFEVTFPKRFTWILKTLRLLPIALYLRLTRRMIKSRG